MLNPSNLFDLNIGWALSHDQFMRNGDVWVGITAKPITVAALKSFDPERYGSLSFANPLPLDDPRNCTDIQRRRPDSSRMTENGLAWDINSQVGAWLKSDAASNPLDYGRGGAARSRRSTASATRRPAATSYDYINAIHPLVVADDGRADLRRLHRRAWPAAASSARCPINQCEPAPPDDDPRRQITQRRRPGHPRSCPSRTTCSASPRGAPTATRRRTRSATTRWRAPAHATPDELYYSAAPGGHRQGRPRRAAAGLQRGSAQPLPELDLLRRGPAEPRPLGRATGIAAAAWPSRSTSVNGAPVLDEFGNVTGGLRSPYVDVPTSTWFGSSTGASFCFIAGHEVPFDQALLRRRCTRPTGVYVRAVVRDVGDLVARRYLTVADGLSLIRDAARADVP